jgi:ABC-2 type transport system ATP-binding protein
METNAIIRVDDLVVTYPDSREKAVNGVSFWVREGEAFGFLGRNGSGKTTTINALIGLLPVTSGRVVVAGNDLSKNRQAAQMIGCVPQQHCFDAEARTVREDLLRQAKLHRMNGDEADRRSSNLLEALGLSSLANRSPTKISGGEARRLDLALALIHNPSILFLDEPTTGLDVESRRVLWQLIREMRSTGATIFLTTQHLEEADQLVDRVAIIARGRIVASGSPTELKDQVDPNASLEDAFIHLTGHQPSRGPTAVP